VPVAQYVHSIALRIQKLLPLNRPKSNQFNIFPRLASLADKLQSHYRLPRVARPGCKLTISFETRAVPAIAAPKKRRSLLPVLIVLFIVSYGLMTMLIVEQGAAIQSQSDLIKILTPDSRELWALKGKAITDKQMAKKKQGHGNDPSSQSPAQSPTGPQSHSENQIDKTAKPDPHVPPVPAYDLIDQRRALHSI